MAPIEPKQITRAAIAGLVLSGLGIGLFVIIWNVLGSAGVADFPRLFAAMCAPPAIIAAIVGFFLLIVRPYEPADDDAADD
jgi:lipopolysaccharide export LptBFGC system permease protein LptF